MATSGPYWGVHPETTLLKHYVVTMRVSDNHPARVVNTTWTRRGAERKRRLRQRQYSEHASWQAGRGISAGPGLRFDVLDMRLHPDRSNQP